MTQALDFLNAHKYVETNQNSAVGIKVLFLELKETTCGKDIIYQIATFMIHPIITAFN